MNVLIHQQLQPQPLALTSRQVYVFQSSLVFSVNSIVSVVHQNIVYLTRSYNFDSSGVQGIVAILRYGFIILYIDSYSPELLYLCWNTFIHTQDSVLEL